MFLDDKNLDVQTGRRPSGVCGAALFIAAHIHGFERSKADVVCLMRLQWFEAFHSGLSTLI